MKSLVCAATFFSASVLALPLDTYNLIVLEDLEYLSGHVQGKTLVGGNLNPSNSNHSLGFGSRLSGGTSLEVVGNIGNVGITLENGTNLIYGGTNNAAHINRNGGGEVYYDPSMSIKAVADELFAATSSYNSLSANGTVGVVSSKVLFEYSGVDDTAVFDFDSGLYLNSNLDLNLDAGNAENIVINVSGKNIEFGNQKPLDGFNNGNHFDWSKIIWNFFEAETIDFGNAQMVGAVLAPFASVSGGSQFDGSVAVKTFQGSQQFHTPVYRGPQPPKPPTTQIPNPSSLILIALGLLALRTNQRTLRPA
nr:choice-of-anchor A family protein [Echinimonas agarilytica]